MTTTSTISRLFFFCSLVGLWGSLTWTQSHGFSYSNSNKNPVRRTTTRRSSHRLKNYNSGGRHRRGLRLSGSSDTSNGSDSSPEQPPPDSSSPPSTHSQKRQDTDDLSQEGRRESTTFEPTASAFDASATRATTGTSAGIPSYKSILLFTSTTILIWLSEPLLSLVDTTVVGMTSTTSVAPLAALGPATMLIDSCVYLCYFLSISTTNSIAKHLANNNPRALQRTTSHVLGVATVLGIIMMGIVYGMGRPLLTWMAGGPSQASSLVPLALQYCRIRCIVAPLAILGMTAQSICLACLDTVTPAKAVVVASVLNIVGDILLAKPLGIAGAAIATAVASSASALILLQQVRIKTKAWAKEDLFRSTGMNGSKMQLNNNITRVIDGAPVILNQTGGVETRPALSSLERVNGNDMTTTTPTKTCTAKGGSLQHLHNDEEEQIPFMSFPDKSSFTKLCRLAGPIFFVLLGKVICYSAMTLRATDFGMVPLACHNIMMRIFFFYATFGDSLSQAAQSYLPPVLVRKGASRTKSVKTLLGRLSKMAAAIGFLNLTMSKWILHTCGRFFSSNPEILSMMQQHSTVMSLALLLHPFIMTFEGAMIATQDLLYMVANYALTMGLLFGQLKFATTTFGGVWVALFVYQALRLVQFSTRVWKKTVRNGEGDNADSIADASLPAPAAA